MKNNPISIIALARIIVVFSLLNYVFALFMNKPLKLAMFSSLDQFAVLVVVYSMGKDLFKVNQ
jgi:hypothetical protein